jgi:hypothetical protein
LRLDQPQGAQATGRAGHILCAMRDDEDLFDRWFSRQQPQGPQTRRRSLYLIRAALDYDGALGGAYLGEHFGKLGLLQQRRALGGAQDPDDGIGASSDPPRSLWRGTERLGASGRCRCSQGFGPAMKVSAP